jgi:hypothetical protein
MPLHKRSMTCSEGGSEQSHDTQNVPSDDASSAMCALRPDELSPYMAAPSCMLHKHMRGDTSVFVCKSFG